MADHAAQHGGGGYEKKDADLKLIVICGIIVFAVVIVSFIIVRQTFVVMDRAEGNHSAEVSPMWEGQVLPPSPRLRVNAKMRLAELRAREHRLLNTYGWVDELTGTARIPVDRAKELVLQGHGLASLPVPEEVDALSDPGETSLPPSSKDAHDGHDSSVEEADHDH